LIDAITGLIDGIKDLFWHTHKVEVGSAPVPPWAGILRGAGRQTACSRNFRRSSGRLAARRGGRAARR
jgi:hypothetical protein